MDLQLKDRVAVVTGGGLGIGKAVSRTLLAEGAKVVIASRTQATLDATARELHIETGGDVVALACDTTSTASVRAMIDAAAATFGRLDILVNGAAAPSGLVRNAIEDADPELLLADLNTKVVGYLRCAQAATVHFKAGGYGRIVNIGGLTGRSSHALSGMRNLAVVHMTKALSDQLGPYGVTVNTVHPGVVETEHIHELYEMEAVKKGVSVGEIEQGYIDRTPIGRVLSAEEIGQTICFLASPVAGAITGESIGIDGGLTRGIFL